MNSTVMNNIRRTPYHDLRTCSFGFDDIFPKD